LSPASDRGLQEIVPHRGDTVTKLLVVAEFIRRLDRVGEQVKNNFLVVGDAFFGSVFALLG